MKIAVTYENGQVFQHFGHTAQFKLYDVENGAVASSQVVDTNGSGHGALAGFLQDHQVDALICGGIGGGAQMALAEAGIRLYAGCPGDADAAGGGAAGGHPGQRGGRHLRPSPRGITHLRRPRLRPPRGGPHLRPLLSAIRAGQVCPPGFFLSGGFGK